MTNKLKVWLVISVVTMLVSGGVIVGLRPVWGIDFTGGSLLEIRVVGAAPEEVKTLLKRELDLAALVQRGEAGTVLIKTVALDENRHQQVVTLLSERGIMQEELRFESIGPTIGAELRRKAVVAVVVVVVALIIYLAYAFRQAAGLIAAWKFGVAAVYALLHDLLLVMALFVVLGRLYGVAIDTLFVTAALAILGYSVNDTIVIFNRIKIEWLAAKSDSLLTTIGKSIRASLMRSLNTSLTTLLVLGALMLFGGTTIRWFIVALAAGTLVGTYSSLLVAPPFLYYLAKK